MLYGLSLFSGIGGLDLAFNWAGGNILAFCEIDNYCQKVLRKHWPDVPIFNDVHTLNKEAMENAGLHSTIDIIYGGFPCQPFSLAGNKKGKDDTRYLWPEFSRLVGDFRPRWVVAENVPGILNIAADTVCSDLEREGYEVGIWDYEAASVGAKHRRERIFFVAHAGCSLRQRVSEAGDVRKTNEEGYAATAQRPDCSLEAGLATYSNGKRCKEQRQSFTPEQALAGIERCCGWELEPGICRSSHGFSNPLDGSISPIATGTPNRTNRLKALGNAVVPQQAFPIFKAIMEADNFD